MVVCFILYLVIGIQIFPSLKSPFAKTLATGLNIRHLSRSAWYPFYMLTRRVFYVSILLHLA